MAIRPMFALVPATLQGMFTFEMATDVAPITWAAEGLDVPEDMFPLHVRAQGQPHRLQRFMDGSVIGTRLVKHRVLRLSCRRRAGSSRVLPVLAGNRLQGTSERGKFGC
ncbi:MAG: hypothetical protein ABJL99_04215 [Aliishimia sp.]